MPTIDSDMIFIPGPGILQWQPYTADTSIQFKQMRTFGATGGLKLTTTREIIQWEEGAPLQAVVRDVLRESGAVEIILAEKSLNDLVVELGDGTVTEEIADNAVNEVHHLFLRGYGWQVLPGVRYGSIAHPTTINSVVSTDTTPVSYTETDDYEIGQVEGSCAIKRVVGSDIADGQEVIVDVTFDQPARKTLTMGGRNALSYMHLMMTKRFRDGIRREMTKIYKSTTNGTIEENYSKDGYSERTCTFNIIADTTRSEGDRLWKKFQETE